jgi:L-fuconolactonase
MEILDAQVHAWLADRPSRPWISTYRRNYRERPLLLIHAGQSMGPEELLVEMGEAGVDGGALSPVGVYGADNSFELDAAGRFPRKFCVIGWVDHQDPNLESNLRSDVARGMLGVRILQMRDQSRVDRGEFDHVLALCRQLGCAVALTLTQPVSPAMPELMARFSDVRFLLDHLGLELAPPTLGPAPPDPFEHLDDALALAALPNVSLKLTGAPSLSHEGYPFRDVWPAIRRILDAYGAERVMWGSDFTRTSGLHSYYDAVHYLKEIPGLADEELAWLYGGSLRQTLSWSDDPHVRPRRLHGLRQEP